MTSWSDRTDPPAFGEVAAAHPGGSPRPHLVFASDGSLLDP